MNLTAEELNHQNVYATQDEIEWMRATGVSLPARAQAVMIGAGPGVLMLSLLESGRKDLEPCAIDLHSTQWLKRHLELATDYQPSRIPALYRERLRLIEGFDSYDVGLGWVDGPIDLLIIDGDHSDRGILRDMEAWLKHVAPGGLVFFHDYDYDGTVWAGFRKRPAIEIEDLPEVKGVVDLTMAEYGWPQVWRGGCSAVFRRPHD